MLLTLLLLSVTSTITNYYFYVYNAVTVTNKKMWCGHVTIFHLTRSWGGDNHTGAADWLRKTKVAMVNQSPDQFKMTHSNKMLFQPKTTLSVHFCVKSGKCDKKKNLKSDK